MVGRRNKDDPTKDPPIALGEVGVEKEHAVFKIMTSVYGISYFLEPCSDAAKEFIWVNGVKSTAIFREIIPNDRIIFGSGAVFIFRSCGSAGDHS